MLLSKKNKCKSTCVKDWTYFGNRVEIFSSEKCGEYKWESCVMRFVGDDYLLWDQLIRHVRRHEMIYAQGM